jgi:Uma2 family endonuclease
LDDREGAIPELQEVIMTAEPVPEYTPEPRPAQGSDALPDWLIPPPDGWKAEDLDRIPHLPAHTELIDGNLVFASPQRIFHVRMISILEQTLERMAPERLRVYREMTVTLGKRQRPEPDLQVVRAEAVADDDQSDFRPADVVLVVEVVSPDSIIRDRVRKPQLYAEAGIPHYWRVEKIDGEPVVFVHELDPATEEYVPTGAYRNRLKLSAPFEMDIDLTQVKRL